jgi:hypothetical protein
MKETCEYCGKSLGVVFVGTGTGNAHEKCLAHRRPPFNEAMERAAICFIEDCGVVHDDAMGRLPGQAIWNATIAAVDIEMAEQLRNFFDKLTAQLADV